ncbi:MAG TPA: FMN-binding protein [Sedimentisphaerales bacterium]|nr:FMN-binding protein [Sedimentisphaerales bacterium]
MGKLKHFIEQSWLLIVSSLCFGILVAATDAGLSEKIEQNKANKLNRLTLFLLREAKYFVPVDAQFEVGLGRGKSEKVTVYKAVGETQECVGWSLMAVGDGFSGRIELVVAVDADFGKLMGYEVLVSSETPGFGDRIKDDYYRSQFRGAPAGGLKLVSAGSADKVDSEIVAITGATISSEAVVGILNDTVGQIKEQMQRKGLIQATKAPRHEGE